MGRQRSPAEAWEQEQELVQAAVTAYFCEEPKEYVSKTQKCSGGFNYWHQKSDTGV